MNGYDREPSSEASIRFRDCDPLGHLYHTRYADYILDAREDHLRDYGLDLVKTAQRDDLAWVVQGLHLHYFASARHGERVRMRTRLLSYDSKRLLVEGRMYGAKRDDLKALVWWRFRAIAPSTGRASEHDEQFMNLFAGVVNPAPEETFEARALSFARTPVA